MARARWRLPGPGRLGLALGLAELVVLVAVGLLAHPAPYVLAAATALGLAVAWAADLFRPRLVLSIVDDAPSLLVVAGAVTIVLFTASGAPIVLGLLVLAGLVAAHAVVYAGTTLRRRHGRLQRRVLLIGSGSTARRLAASLLARPQLGLTPVGFVATGHGGVAGQARGLPLPMVGPVTTLPRRMAEARVDAVVVVLSEPAGDAEVAAVEGLLAVPTDVFAVPAWFPEVGARTRHPAERIGRVSLVRIYRRGTPAPVRLIKRAAEVLVALVSLSILLPVCAILALPVFIETRGVLVRRARVDEAGRRVWVRRFRTRRARAVARPGTTFSVEIPGPTGQVGRLLRRTRLVALPEVVAGLLERVRHSAGWAEPRSIRWSRRLRPSRSPAPASADQPQVDTGQFTR
ncbi:sugar transferase [uncultured Nocardioides sp.]|uniref:sugar transferase n=1 Tax=uncultured Nocardioides sp. TaxID=198441 RepID=UPI00262976E6|nr:sugar transferase [uncultured Nocardioides sp.]